LDSEASRFDFLNLIGCGLAGCTDAAVCEGTGHWGISLCWAGWYLNGGVIIDWVSKPIKLFLDTNLGLGLEGLKIGRI
jgi:hypothetical protein